MSRWTSKRSRAGLSTRTSRLEAEIELFDPDIEFVPLRAALEDIVYRGHDGIRQLPRDMTSQAIGRLAILRPDSCFSPGCRRRVIQVSRP
jgi:hypothetical protein